MKEKIMTTDQIKEIIEILKKRFNKNMNRHNELKWEKIEKRLLNNPTKLWSLNEMELTGGEPDVVFYDESTDEYIYIDCSSETPIGRRGLCYDLEALNQRKTNKPKDNAIDVARNMGIEILNEEQYRELQKIGEFDLKTSSWILTSEDVRKLGGALFCDRRYNKVFVYHNGADSYYSVRGFRGLLRL